MPFKKGRHLQSKKVKSTTTVFLRPNSSSRQSHRSFCRPHHRSCDCTCEFVSDLFQLEVLNLRWILLYILNQLACDLTNFMAPPFQYLVLRPKAMFIWALKHHDNIIYVGWNNLTCQLPLSVPPNRCLKQHIYIYICIQPVVLYGLWRDKHRRRRNEGLFHLASVRNTDAYGGLH